MFAACKDDLGRVWRLKRDKKGCFSWHKVLVKKAPSYRGNMTLWEYADTMWIFGGCGQSPANVGHVNDVVDFAIRRCNYACIFQKHQYNVITMYADNW